MSMGLQLLLSNVISIGGNGEIFELKDVHLEEGFALEERNCKPLAKTGLDNMQSDGHKKGERVHESSSPSLSGAAFPVKCTIVVHVTNAHSAAEKNFWPSGSRTKGRTALQNFKSGNIVLLRST
ncbi:hypothetical protein PC129_g446 [Phytophthora cactorum]|uniref:Uncharacterized protein n=1 Tax=Phytophthora cactorum TaxID=29920 RepID=A0A8T1GIL7_9STRA|nr:hypothetical protein Pcac1_g3748 [Phytophthora cactorum]KAG2847750.1 hypothetical protein PC112_g979 [Phytophthora cactorum]KAG2848073.1 hypothetical protein PC111_g537 [Phytophthora cactorum]KAG2868435.1 hypothetical protein PC113_g1093 [Phytophthora cactorum]KAG2933660.1 hypothetical protein PC114_g1344 [Phytophthora cactorum]